MKTPDEVDRRRFAQTPGLRWFRRHPLPNEFGHDRALPEWALVEVRQVRPGVFERHLFTEEEIAAGSLQKLLDLEARTGPITPAPIGTEFPGDAVFDRMTDRECAAIVKRELIDNGTLPAPPEEVPYYLRRKLQEVEAVLGEIEAAPAGTEYPGDSIFFDAWDERERSALVKRMLIDDGYLPNPAAGSLLEQTQALFGGEIVRTESA